MKLLLTTLAIVYLSLFMSLQAQEQVRVIPYPAEVTMQAETCKLKSGQKIHYLDASLYKEAAFLEKKLADLNYKMKVIPSKKAAKGINLSLNNRLQNKEGYQLIIAPKQVLIKGGSPAGVFYGIQTLLQQLTNGDLRCGTIEDAPRYEWRGYMLDEARHFSGEKRVKQILDLMAYYKMNRFHWHLTDAQGWRIEIKQYPKLATIGGEGCHSDPDTPAQYYTQEQIRDIIAYAKERHIEIIPEIDMPGHAEAALHSYPELGCFNRPVEIPKLGFTPNIFCAGKENTLQFLKNVLDEICTLFPSSYIHLGGDEAPKDNWNKCPDCQKRIANLGLKNSHDLQLWFSAQMAEYLKSKGKKAIFWGDVVYNDGYPLPDNIVIQWWNYRGHKDLALRNALRHHYPVICSTNYYTYLNFPLTPWKGYEQARTFDLKDVYMNNPSYKATQESNPLIRGMGCALWTDDGVKEYMIDRRLFPRILALAEQMWHNGPLMDFDAFYQRILHKKKWFENRGYGFGPALTEETDNNYKWE